MTIYNVVEKQPNGENITIEQFETEEQAFNYISEVNQILLQYDFLTNESIYLYSIIVETKEEN